MSFEDIRRQFPDWAHKIESDPPVTPPGLGGQTLRDALIATVDAAAAKAVDEAGFRQTYDEFCDRYVLNGPLVPLTPDERLGHVVSMNDFTSYIADPFLSRATAGPPSFGALGYPPSRPLSDPVLRTVLLGLRRDDLIHSGDGTIWCFRGQPPSSDPLGGERVELLPCRLGLKRTKESGLEPRWLAFPIVAQPVAWRRPTFADTSWDYLSDWVPGGLTAQAPGYACGGGFSELVGRGATFGQLETAVGPFVAEWPRLGHGGPP